MHGLGLTPTYDALLAMIGSGLAFLWLGGKFEKWWEAKEELKDAVRHSVEDGFALAVRTEKVVAADVEKSERRVQALIWRGMDRTLGDALAFRLSGQARLDALDLWAHVRSQKALFADVEVGEQQDPIAKLRAIANRVYAPFHRNDC